MEAFPEKKRSGRIGGHDTNQNPLRVASHSSGMTSHLMDRMRSNHSSHFLDTDNAFKESSRSLGPRLEETPLPGIEYHNKIFCSVWLDGETIACGTKDNQLLVWNTRTKRLWILGLPTSVEDTLDMSRASAVGVHCLKINRNRSLLATGGANPNQCGLFLLPEMTPFMLLRGHTEALYNVAWASADKLISCSDDGTLKAWSLRSAVKPDGSINRLPRPLETAKVIVPPNVSAQLSASSTRVRVRDVCFNSDVGGGSIGACITSCGTVAMFDIHTFNQTTHHALPDQHEVVCIEPLVGHGLYAVGSQNMVALVDPREREGVVQTIELISGSWGVRSLDLRHDVLSMGGGGGGVFFFDLRSFQYIPEPEAPSASSFSVNTSFQTVRKAPFWNLGSEGDLDPFLDPRECQHGEGEGEDVFSILPETPWSPGRSYAYSPGGAASTATPYQETLIPESRPSSRGDRGGASLTPARAGMLGMPAVSMTLNSSASAPPLLPASYDGRASYLLPPRPPQPMRSERHRRPGEDGDYEMMRDEEEDPRSPLQRALDSAVARYPSQQAIPLSPLRVPMRHPSGPTSVYPPPSTSDGSFDDEEDDEATFLPDTSSRISVEEESPFMRATGLSPVQGVVRDPAIPGVGRLSYSTTVPVWTMGGGGTPTLPRSAAEAVVSVRAGVPSERQRALRFSIKKPTYRVSSLHTSDGWYCPHNINAVGGGDPSSRNPNACYTHCWSPDGTRLFLGGGPLRSGLAGCYAAVFN